MNVVSITKSQLPPLLSTGRHASPLGSSAGSEVSESHDLHIWSQDAKATLLYVSEKVKSLGILTRNQFWPFGGL